MKKLTASLLAACAAALCPAVSAATFTLDQQTDVTAPSTRGNANTTYFGWELFDTGPIDDSTPDIGTTSAGVNFKTTNGENHRSGSGNLYIGTTGNTLYERVTVATDGTVGTGGVTTIIAQFVTPFGDFPAGQIQLSSINGVLPGVVRGVNAAGEGQVWAKWQIPGNAASYVFTVTGPPGATAFSMDRLVVDTHWSATAATAQPDDMRLRQPLNLRTELITPSQRGTANTTWFGWETFNDVGSENVPINDASPDIGTTTTGVSFVTTNAEDHISSTRNLYVGSGTLAEEVTVATNGTVGVGFTTIIAQAITAFGGFPDQISFGAINGVAPTVVQTTNSAGKGQVWAKWEIPGNAASYSFTVSGPADVTGYSFDKFVVDTFWSSTAYQRDTVIEAAPAQTFTMTQTPDVVAPSSRGAPFTTWFGWETFDEQGTSAPINDSTPNIGTTTTGVNFKTTNGEDHVSGSGNVFLSNGTLAEEVTVVTNGEEGPDGTTTIIAQIASQIGFFPNPVTLGDINGVTPEVVTRVNSIDRVQVWAKWVIPGNQETYTFTITGGFVNNPSTPYSFERVVVDTLWQPSGTQDDTMIATTPAVAHVMSGISDVVVPSTRGNINTTWFGWETFNDVSNRADPTGIDDSTPDLGATTTSGANFKTTNGQDHLLASGNLYFPFGTLAERITVPTNGTVGAAGVTTIMLQIASAPGFGGFADTVTLSSINGVAPTIVQAENNLAGGTGQLWAIWNIPGNEATYTIDITGPENQPHFSFDRVVVDTLWSRTAVTTDSMAAAAPSITSASPLPIGAVDSAYSTQLEGTEGTAPYSFAVSSGAVSAGLTLSANGLLSGTPTAAGVANFSVELTDTNGLKASKSFSLTITTAPSITTASPLAGGLVGAAYTANFEATGGTAPYAWTVSGGSLPAGLTLSAAGALTGEPTAAGVSTFTVQVSDDHDFTATKEFSLTVTSLTIATVSPLPGAVRNVSYSQALTATGGTTPYTWSVSGGALPVGLTLSTAGVISGKPTAAGNATFTVRLTDAANLVVTKSFSLTVFATYQTPAVNPIDFGVITVGTQFSYTVTASNLPKTFLITGLPAGVKAASATGVISGRPVVPGVYNIKVRATNSGGASAIVTAPLVVKALPANFIGTFTGIIERDATANGSLGSLLTLTTTTNGSYTAKVTTGSKATSVKGFLASTGPQVSVAVGGSTLELNLANNLVAGTHGAAAVNGWRSIWNTVANPASSRGGYYSVAIGLANAGDEGVEAIPQGAGFATFTVAETGAVAVAGKTADGQTITTSGPMGPDGEIAVYTSQYSNKGSILGKMSLSEDAGGLFGDNTASGALTWQKPVTSGKTYAAGFGPINLNVYGKYLAASSKGNIVLGLPETGTANLVFVEGGDLGTSEIEPEAVFTYTDENKIVLPANSAKLALSINVATGAVSGKFTLTETTPKLIRSVNFLGQVVRLTDGSTKAVGYFLLAQKPANGQPAASAPILSGGFMIEQQ